MSGQIYGNQSLLKRAYLGFTRLIVDLNWNIWLEYMIV